MSPGALWFKDAIIYEVRIRSFFDSDDDGIGDIRGLTAKLDYLADLGIDTIWVLPFYPSPLKDDGYDIADYSKVHPTLGTLRDFKQFLKAAHQRGLRVVTELVINHTSDQHPWFQRARRAAPGSRYRDWYVWSDDPKRYKEARIIFQDFEASNWTWDPVAQAYFWHRFYSNQPDLNFDNPDVQKAVLSLVDYWLDMGVDGLRLDAIPYLFERDGTNCENLPETHAFLQSMRKHIDKKFKDRMLLAEANQWPEDAVAYFGEGDECHMAFHFPIMPRLFMALRMEDNFPILDILEQTPDIPSTCQWAIFLRNHDELTLEMVTDEERDYMVDAYAADRHARINLGIRRRLAPLLDNNRRRIELMNALLFSLPGTPVLYYGDEIGMGDNIYLGDRDGVRTPMQWNGDRNAGFSRANPQKLVLPPVQDPEYHFSAINVEVQQGNPSSLLWWTKRIIALRKHFAAFGRGSFEPLFPSNRRVLAFLRRFEEEVVLVVANLSRFAQYVELDLSEFNGHRPRELFGNTDFPAIGDLPYLVTLGPHGFYWLSLGGVGGEAEKMSQPKTSVATVRGDWDAVLRGRGSATLAHALSDYLPSRRWFRGKARRIKNVKVTDSIALARRAAVALIDVHYTRGDPESYLLPLRYVGEPGAPDHAILRLKLRGKRGDEEGYLVDCSDDEDVALALLRLVIQKKRLKGRHMTLTGVPTPEMRKRRPVSELPKARALGAEQTNTSYLYGDEMVGKLLRKIDMGSSVELEVLSHLHDCDVKANVPEYLGHLDLEFDNGQMATAGIFQRFVPNQGEAWSLTVDAVEGYYEQILTSEYLQRGVPTAPGGPLTLVGTQPPQEISDLIGHYLVMAGLLGTRTAELHHALAARGPDPGFEPEEFGALAKRSFYQSLRNLHSRAFDELRDHVSNMEGAVADEARLLLKQDRQLRSHLAKVRDVRLSARRMRIHGDYHLGQVLYTGKDFVILDFEGEPARSLSHRRTKRSPLADVAGMLRSFHYAAHAPLLDTENMHLREVDAQALRGFSTVWLNWVSAIFLEKYLEKMSGTDLLPRDPVQLSILLDAYLLDKALYELSYELNNRPTWVEIPVVGILNLLRD